METGTILKWLKKEGEPFEEQEPLAEIETEKSTIEFPAYEAGKLVKILVPEGETVEVGTPIAEVELARAPKKGRPAPAEAEPAAKPAAAKPAAKPAPEPPAEPPAPAPERERRVPTGAPERVKASPLARRIAEEHELDLARLRGTGPGGRIVEADVRGALRGAPAAEPSGDEYRDERASQIRRTIARRISEAKRTIPHFYLTTEVEADALHAFRQQFNAALDSEEERLSYNDLVVKACAIALGRHPRVNTQFAGEDVIRSFAAAHIGIAVALEPEGLVVPVIRNCDRKPLREIGREARELAARAREGKLKPEEYSGGTFSVSNLGMYGITQFQAVINPPEAAILAVGALREEAVARDGRILPGRRMSLTISVDHRLVDGAQAAEFLREVRLLLENPLALVI